MTSQPSLTDSKSQKMHRSRAHEDGLFLHDLTADELQDRMSMVNREFKSIAIVSGFPTYWKNKLPNAQSISDGDTLEFSQASFDLTIHALSLHWANDPVGQIIQCRRALKPDGLFLAATFGGETLHELRSCLGQAEIEITGGLSPRVAPMGQIRDMGGLLQRAGLALPVADAQKTNVAYRDIWHLMHDLRFMGETNALLGRLRKPTSRQIFERANELYLKTFPSEAGGINATFEILYLAGWMPDQNQPQPLKPGSAQSRLADALNTKEKPLLD